MRLNNKPTRSSKIGHWLLALLAVVATGWGMSSCEQSDVDRTFEGPYFVRFTDSTLNYKESYSKTIPIKVHNVGPILNQPITINYTVSGTAREGKDYSVGDTKGTVTIPANQSSGAINLKLINNANNILESQTIIFTLTSVQPSSLQVGFGKDNIVGKQLKFTIQDDCLFGGLYTGSALVRGRTYTVPDVEVTSTDCKTYTLNNWNIGLTEFPVIGNSSLFSFVAQKPTLTFTDNGDNSLTIPKQTNDNLGSTGSLQGNGAWNPRNRQLTLNLQATVQIGTLKDTTVVYRDTTLLFTQTYIPQ
ncbi:hypothetical protein [Spirosoma koreense]